MVLENARQVAPRDPVVWNRLGFVEMQLGTRAQAMEYFQKAVELGETYPEAQINYGAMLVETEAFPDAVKHLELAVKHAPASVAAHLNLGNAYRGAKEFEKAEREYRRALELDPKLADAWFNMGLLYLDGEKPGLPAAERLEKAIAFLDKYAADGGADPKVPQYRRDASSLLDKERKRLAREERERLRKEAEARRREEEEARIRAREEEARRAAAAPPPPAAPAQTPGQKPGGEGDRK
jgi:tetratricopeptide (TPR) repeat protein